MAQLKSSPFATAVAPEDTAVLSLSSPAPELPTADADRGAYRTTPGARRSRLSHRRARRVPLISVREGRAAQEMTQALLASRVPVAVYFTPAGAAESSSSLNRKPARLDTDSRLLL